jgi:hypothetical protein
MVGPEEEEEEEVSEFEYEVSYFVVFLERK